MALDRLAVHRHGVWMYAAFRPLPRVKLKIGRDTTYVTQPLRANGLPDYVAAATASSIAAVRT